MVQVGRPDALGRNWSVVMSFTMKFSGKVNLGNAGTIIAGATNRVLRDIGDVYKPALKSETPRRSGKLRRTTIYQIIEGQTSQTLEVRQGARTPDGDFYGGFVRGGTKAHEIRPKRKGGVLVFQIGSVTIFARKVNHPGTKPNPYHKRALRRVGGQIDEIISSAGINIASELME